MRCNTACQTLVTKRLGAYLSCMKVVFPNLVVSMLIIIQLKIIQSIYKAKKVN